MTCDDALNQGSEPAANSFRVTVDSNVPAKAQRTDKPSNIPRRITVERNRNGDVTVALPPTTECGTAGAICTGDGRKLFNGNQLTESGPDGQVHLRP